MKVYKDTKSGLWMQEGGSRYGFSDEIDSYLVGRPYAGVSGGMR